MADLPKQHRAGFLSAVTGADFVEDIGVEAANVGKSEPAIHDVLEHLLIDRAGECIHIGSRRDKGFAFGRFGFADGRFEDVLEDGGKIDLPFTDLFLTERHDDKTGSLQFLKSRRRLRSSFAPRFSVHDKSSLGWSTDKAHSAPGCIDKCFVLISVTWTQIKGQNMQLQPNQVII